MICCGTQAIRNEVLGKSFFYCRQCKSEVNEPKQVTATQALAGMQQAINEVASKIQAGISKGTPQQTQFPFKVGDVVELCKSDSNFSLLPNGTRVIILPTVRPGCVAYEYYEYENGWKFDAAIESTFAANFKLVKRGDTK